MLKWTHCSAIFLKVFNQIPVWFLCCLWYGTLPCWFTNARLYTRAIRALAHFNHHNISEEREFLLSSILKVYRLKPGDFKLRNWVKIHTYIKSKLLSTAILRNSFIFKMFLCVKLNLSRTTLLPSCLRYFLPHMPSLHTKGRPGIQDFFPFNYLLVLSTWFIL